MKPFFIVRGQRNYARFLIPVAYRHLSNGKKHLVFSLGAAEKPILRQRAIELEFLLLESIKKGIPMNGDRFKKFDIVTPNGVRIENINTQSDVDNLLKLAQTEAFKSLLESLSGVAVPPADASPQGLHVVGGHRRAGPENQDRHNNTPQSLALAELLDKFLLLKKVKAATVISYKNVVKEFTDFCKGKCFIAEIMVSDITRYREFLAEKNSPRTIDNKMIVLKSLMNFAISNGYFFGTNPVIAKNLQTRKQKNTEGYGIFEVEEVGKYFKSERFLAEKISDPDYYWCLILEIFSGCRVGELANLQKSQIKKSENSINYLQIRDAKTHAGKREIPLPESIFELGFAKFIEEKNDQDFIFKYKSREGKGAGNAVGKKFSYQIKLENIHRPKLVFHSLRKFLNDFFMKNKVQYELRCQFFGHEIEDTNVAIYSKEFNIEELFEGTEVARKKIILLIGA
jgi:site-specific recombinase XerD